MDNQFVIDFTHGIQPIGSGATSLFFVHMIDNGVGHPYMVRASDETEAIATAKEKWLEVWDNKKTGERVFERNVLVTASFVGDVLG